MTKHVLIKQQTKDILNVLANFGDGREQDHVMATELVKILDKTVGVLRHVRFTCGWRQRDDYGYLDYQIAQILDILLDIADAPEPNRVIILRLIIVLDQVVKVLKAKIQHRRIEEVPEIKSRKLGLDDISAASKE
jgi:hypothetical protein